MNPFFSVCTEVTNREKTIRRTIESIAGQTYRNFEYIIVNNQSDDRSDEVIRHALLELPFGDVTVKYCTTEKRLSDIESWNAPLKHARGVYIVVCEGDDWFAPDHLEKAAQVLLENQNIGLYVSGRGDLDEKVNHEKYRGMHKRIPAHALTKQLMDFVFAPPPSEAIFLRAGNKGPFLYDAEKYVYAAEYGLYDEIVRQGFDGYVNITARTVFRGPSSYRKKLFHIQDAYRMLDQWSERYDSEATYRSMRRKLLMRSIHILASQILARTVERILLWHIAKETFALRTLMPLWLLPKYVMVGIRQQLATDFRRFRAG